MDALVIYLLLGFIVIAGFWWTVFGARIRARLREKGKTAGVSLEDAVNRIDFNKIGTILLVKNAQAGEAIVTQAVAQAKGVTPLGQGRWNLRFADPDDVVLAWTVDANGQGSLYVYESRDMLGSPVGDRQWLKVVKLVEQQLDAAGVAHERQESKLQKTDRTTRTGDSIWSH